MSCLVLPQNRNSHINKGRIYFWTATINKWQRLLEKEAYKKVILDSLEYLTNKGCIDVFAFVIMPNHIHLIWRIKTSNGRESSQGSFLKYTAHRFQKMLQKENAQTLANYRVNASNKRHEFWQRDSLAIPLFTRKVALQKLNYLHNNPLAERWQLATDPCDYPYSSARYYERNEKNYAFLKDLWEEI